MFVRSTIVALVVCVSPGFAGDSALPFNFLTSNCASCHDSGAESDGGFDLSELKSGLAETNFDRWVRVFDRVESGEMPPPEMGELEPSEKHQFLDDTSAHLKDYQEKVFREEGRVSARRLTHLQLERTLHDLLGIDTLLARELPEEQRTLGYPTIAEGQTFSHFQMQNHMNVVDMALDEAFRRAISPPDEFRRELTARNIARRNQKRRCREPEMLDGNAVVWSTRTTFYGRLPVTTAPAPGWYRLTLNASGLNVPKDSGVWCSVTAGYCVSGAPMLRWSGGFSATEQPKTRTFEVWLDKGEMFEVRPGDLTLKQGRFAGGQVGAGEGTPQKLPGLAIHNAVFERFHKGADNDSIFRLLFGDAKLEKQQDPVRRHRTTTEVVFTDGERQLDGLISRFAERAFRRPVSAEEVAPYQQLVKEKRADGFNELDSLRAGYRAILCSPRFLFLQENPGRLDQYALASRLSYFLWNTTPDDRLLQLAKAEKLNRPEILRVETERMLADERGQRFFADFAHDWLDLRDIDFTEPDRRLYSGFDIIVQQSMLDETHRFLNELLTEDLSVSHLIKSRFTFLNNRLARHYGIPNVTGDELQKIALTPESHRGGLLTHGSVLKVTANGTTTSPVVRGVWVSERLLGTEIPDPPGSVPAIEPDIRGATGIRELLAKHKSDQNCAACHRKIDPPGFALENFDPAGQWRNVYGGRKKNRRSKKVDPSEVLPDGTAFQTFAEFQSAVAGHRSKLAENFVRHLLTYGTGAECEFADRDEIERVVASAADDDFGIRSLIHAVVQSRIFQTK